MISSKSILSCLILLLNVCNSFSQNQHKEWTSLLQKYVTNNGEVDYRGFQKDSLYLNKYLKNLESNPPKTSWSDHKTIAYWINAYNAYTIQLVIRHYPIKSIKEIGGKIPFINSSWDIKFINIGTELLDLNNIEHSKLRKNYKDPRLHMALVCASKSCPILLNTAYEENMLDSQLDAQSRKFLSDPFRNSFTNKEAEISMIFKWYISDFSGTMGVRNFLKKHGPSSAQSDQIRIKHKDYDWGINGN
ncbi:MAG: DUF547 domain-containing protein [Saprospiraceae bacterium]|nr:DUF547 domain-containing protein [Saprospiraceae bacterium]MBK7810244.1 DUF547 domain-containing protein [Saprospiraceae bacterium]MBK9629847.1 DUF547 domain-containing protein [Saprospiraceae bacterium]